MAEGPGRISGKRLGQIIWDLGHYYPVSPMADQVSISAVRPHQGYVCWHVGEESIDVLRQLSEGAFHDAKVFLRIYDVTDIMFDGRNAHMSFDIEVGVCSGNYYFTVDRAGRNYLAEVGLRRGDGFFHPFARSGTAFFDRDRPSGNYQVGGLFVGRDMKRIFPVDNVFDAPVFEKMNRELSGLGKEAISVAVILPWGGGGAGGKEALGLLVNALSERIEKIGGSVELFRMPNEEPGTAPEGPLQASINRLSKALSQKVCSAYRERPFDLIHCHDWYSSVAGIEAAKTLKVPMIFSLHSTEYGRRQGQEMSGLSSAVSTLEREAVCFSDLVIVPDLSTCREAITFCDASPEKVVVVPDIFHESVDRREGVTQMKAGLGFDRSAPMILFAGEMSHASGSDILVDALGTVCGRHQSAQFVFAGDGPLKGELEYRVGLMGVSHRCRFLGDVPRETFETLLLASDFVVIPARTWQDEGLARLAISKGRPVLTTRQAGIRCVVHGQNGLVTFDNPGSIVWGIQELLFNPLQEKMIRITARKMAKETPTIESIAVQCYMYYGMITKCGRGGYSA